MGGSGQCQARPTRLQSWRAALRCLGTWAREVIRWEVLAQAGSFGARRGRVGSRCLGERAAAAGQQAPAAAECPEASAASALGPAWSGECPPPARRHMPHALSGAPTVGRLPRPAARPGHRGHGAERGLQGTRLAGGRASVPRRGIPGALAPAFAVDVCRLPAWSPRRSRPPVSRWPGRCAHAFGRRKDHMGNTESWPTTTASTRPRSCKRWSALSSAPSERCSRTGRCRRSSEGPTRPEERVPQLLSFRQSVDKRLTELSG